MKKNVLAFYAHADDVEWSCAGTYAKLIKNGYKGYHLLTTCCNSGTGMNLNLEKTSYSFSMPSNYTRKIRRKEQLNAGKWLGTSEHIFMDHKEAVYTTEKLEVVSPDLKTRKFNKKPEGKEPVAIASCMEKYIKYAEDVFVRLEPEITFTMPPFYNTNPDHSLTGTLALKGFIRASKRVKLGSLYCSSNDTCAGESSYFISNTDHWIVEVSESMEQVWRAGAEHKCQQAWISDIVGYYHGLRRRNIGSEWGSSAKYTELREDFCRIIDWEEARELEV